MLFCFGISFADILRRFLTTCKKKVNYEYKEKWGQLSEEMTSVKDCCLLAFAFFESSILLKMSFAWDSRAAKLEAFRGSEDSFNFFAFFFPPSLTLGVFGAFGVFGGFRVLWALVDLELFCLALARLWDTT